MKKHCESDEAPQSEAAGHARGHWLRRGLTAALCGLTLLAYTGCSKAKKVSKAVDDGIEDVDPTAKDSAMSKLQELVKANQGKGVITGFLTGEGSKVLEGLRKQASNAAGQRRFLDREEIPLSGATILLFDALKPTTAADTTLKTDSTGGYTAVLDEGQYFGFAVYLNLETFELVTASIPNITPIKDSVVSVDTAIALEDVTAPSVTSVFDATSPNDDNIFLVSSIPATNARVNIVFSEPMQRDVASSITIGKVDTSNSSSTLALADTIEDVAKTWNGDSRELTLSIAELDVGAQYGIKIPSGLKDLAKNLLPKTHYATFVAVDPAELADVKFKVAATFPADEGSIKPNQNPSLTFTRPVEIFSVLKQARIEPAIRGFWEVFGPRVVFNHKDPLEVGATYTVTLPATTRDVFGNELGAEHSLSFTVKDFQGAAATAEGEKRDIALAVEDMFDAYLTGDLARFGSKFHPNMRMIGMEGIMGRQQFLDMIRQDVAERQGMAAGFPAPVYDTNGVCQDGHLARWKVMAEGGTADDYLWVESFVSPGMAPRVWDRDRNLLVSGIEWDRTRPWFTHGGKKFGFAPDFSRFAGPMNLDGAQHDERFMGEILRKTSTVVLEPVKLERKEDFQVDPNIIVNGDTAKVAVKMIEHEKFNRVNFRDIHHYCEGGGALEETWYEILRFVLVNDGSRWMVLTILEPSHDMSKEEFEQGVAADDFKFNAIEPLDLISPVNGRDNAADADGKVTFKFKGSAHADVGGYIVGLAEDFKFTGGRPPFGALLFVKHRGAGEEHAFVLDAAAKVAAGGAVPILKRVHDLRLPGWERTMFEFVLDRLVDHQNGRAGVYVWKVIAVKDTTAAQFLSNGFRMEGFFGESDFGAARGYFAVKGFPQGDAFAQFENQQFMPPGGGHMGFGDMDMDGVPDFMENKYKTDPHDRNSYPDFRIDTDGDKLADFLEKLLDPDGSKKLIETKASPEQFDAQIAALVQLGMEWVDSDGDGFPDDVEMMLGFDPNDPLGNPGTRPRAEKPSGVFSGKLRTQMGEEYPISVKAYKDSVLGLAVAYTFNFRSDTLKDTVAAAFNEIMGEFLFQVILPADGPTAGRAYLFRGHYDKVMSLLMGPVDMIAAVPTDSRNFGGGPFVGDWAASGRGESVDQFLMGGGYGPGPAPGPMGPAIYRTPPPGVTEGAKLVLNDGEAILIDEFGDTLAIAYGPEYRVQPDGSYEFFARYEEVDGDVILRGDFGGRMSLVNGQWNLDGHFFEEEDSAGIFKAVPGQLSMKGPEADMELLANPPGLKGTLTGWVQQDEFGAGFGGYMPPPPCDPALGPCNDPGYMPPPGGTFTRPYIAGVGRFREVLGRDGIQAGAAFYVTLNGRVFKSVNDSAHIIAMKAPHCGQIKLKVEQIPLRADASQTEIDQYERDRQMLESGNHVIILIEDPYIFDRPAVKDKIFDAQGEVRTNVYVAEPRPAQEYAWVDPNMSCDVMLPPPCDPLLDPMCGTQPPPCDPMLDPNCPDHCDPALGPCDDTTSHDGPMVYAGGTDVVLDLLARSGYQVAVFSGPDMPPTMMSVDAEAHFDAQLNAVVVKNATFSTSVYVVLASQMDPSKPMVTPEGLLGVVPVAALAGP